MHFIVHCLDRTDGARNRSAHADAHQSYLGQAPIKILVAGPLLADDGSTPIGSAFLLEADNGADVTAFNSNDPYSINGVWDRVQIHPFLKRRDHR